MAYGEFTGYVPGPQPGMTLFQRNGAPPIPAFGPAADDLRAKIDASAALGPQAVAANDVPSAAPPADYEAASEARAASAFDAPPAPVSIAPQPAPNMSQAPANPAASAFSGASPAPATGGGVAAGLAEYRDAAKQVAASQAAQPKRQAVPLVQDKAGRIIYAEPGVRPGEPDVVYKNVAPTAGSPGGYQPSSMKISGATTAATPADLEALRENSIDQKLAYQQAYDIHSASLAAQQGEVAAQLDANRVAQQQALQRQQEVQAKTDQMQANYDQLKQDAANSKVDPTRYTSGAAGIVNALAMGLGTYSAAINKTPNFAANFIQQQINADIASQEANIRIKGSAAQTALGDLQRQMGSLELAKTAYQGQVLQQSKLRLDALANATASREAAANYIQGAAQLDAALQANDLKFRQQAAGQVETELKYRAPTTGTPGGRVPVSLEEAEGLRRIYPQLRSNQKEADASHAQEQGLQGNAQVAHAAGFVLNPETDQWEPGPEAIGAGSWAADKVGYETEQHKNVRAALKTYVPKKAHALGERPPPLAQVENSVHGYIEGRTGATLLSHLNEDRKALRAGVTPVAPTSAEAESDGEGQEQ